MTGNNAFIVGAVEPCLALTVSLREVCKVPQISPIHPVHDTLAEWSFVMDSGQTSCPNSYKHFLESSGQPHHILSRPYNAV